MFQELAFTHSLGVDTHFKALQTWQAVGNSTVHEVFDILSANHLAHFLLVLWGQRIVSRGEPADGVVLGGAGATT